MKKPRQKKKQLKCKFNIFVEASRTKAFQLKSTNNIEACDAQSREHPNHCNDFICSIIRESQHIKVARRSCVFFFVPDEMKQKRQDDVEIESHYMIVEQQLLIISFLSPLVPLLVA